MASVLDIGSSNIHVRLLYTSAGQGHCVVFLGKTLDSYSASLHSFQVYL